MAAEHESVLFDIHDVKVYPLVSDSGASPVYGDAVDVYGAAEASLDPNLVSAVLKGDGRTIARKGKLDTLTGGITYGRLSIDVLNVLFEMTLDDTLADRARGRLRSGAKTLWFGMAFRIEDADNDIEDVVPLFYKCQVTGGTLLGQSTDSFGQPSFEFEAIGLDCHDEDGSDNDWTSMMADVDFWAVDHPLPANLAA